MTLAASPGHGRAALPPTLAPSSASLAAAELQRRLSLLNHRRLAPATPDGAWRGELDEEMALRALELEFVEEERAEVAAQAATAPRDPAGFLAWYEDLRETGPGQGDPLFPWLAEEASLEQMHWFLTQEVAGEAGFDDLVALTQLKFPVRAKLELARNYWDEMGRGNEKGMHGPMLERLAAHLGIEPGATEIVWESLALANLMVALAANRRYAYQSVGAGGAIELTAPGRAVLVNAGLKRLGVPARARHYFALHGVLDVKHSAAWNREILVPLVEADPAAAPLIAEGALLRLRCGERCFERYRQEFGLNAG